MGKMSELNAQIKEMRSCAETIIEIADALTEMFASDEEQPDTAPEQKEQLSFEEVRHRCALAAQAGFSAEVKSIITGFGAKKLSDVSPFDYEELLKKTEALGKAEVKSDV